MSGSVCLSVAVPSVASWKSWDLEFDLGMEETMFFGLCSLITMISEARINKSEKKASDDNPLTMLSWPAGDAQTN